MIILLLLLYVHTLWSKPDTYTFEAPILKIPLGECTTIQAITHFPQNGSEIVSWKRDTKVLKNNKRVKISGKRVNIASIRRSDHAYYQAIVYNPYMNVIEITDIWLNVIGCGKNQKENVPQSTKCEELCVDKCPEDWWYVPDTDTKCVQYFSTTKSWSEASESCQSIGGELVTIQTRNENTFIADMLQTAVGAWIGLNDRKKEAIYIWNFRQSNTPSFYTWGENEPSNFNKGCNIENCVTIKGSNGKWNDVVCVSFNTFVCEVLTSYNGTDKVDWACTSRRCYRYFHGPLVWKDALYRCQQQHATGQLATIESSEENELVSRLLLREEAWIGLNDIWEAGLYTWNTYKGRDNKASYKNWDKNEPNDKFYEPLARDCSGEDCVQIKQFGGNVTWHDLGCQTKLPYICERIRERSFSTGAYVGMVIGSFIFLSIIGGLIHAAYEKHKRTAVKDIIKAAYVEDISMREKNNHATFREVAQHFMKT